MQLNQLFKAMPDKEAQSNISNTLIFRQGMLPKPGCLHIRTTS
jgi:hypothetical protein